MLYRLIYSILYIYVPEFVINMLWGLSVEIIYYVLKILKYAFKYIEDPQKFKKDTKESLFFLIIFLLFGVGVLIILGVIALSVDSNIPYLRDGGFFWFIIFSLITAIFHYFQSKLSWIKLLRSSIKIFIWTFFIYLFLEIHNVLGGVFFILTILYWIGILSDKLKTSAKVK